MLYWLCKLQHSGVNISKVFSAVKIAKKHQFCLQYHLKQCVLGPY